MKKLWYIKNKYKIKKFAKRISFKKNIVIFNDLYQYIDGYQASKKNLNKLNNTTHLYGEIDFFSFAALLSLINPQSNAQFIDLGSGTGKACLAAALAFNIQYCRGIEISSQLHAKALQVHAKCSLKLKKQLSFINDDFFNQNLNDATIIFINATAFFGEQWQKLEQYLINRVPVNCHILISSKKLSQNYFNLITCKAINMAYGQSHVYIYQRHS